MAPNPKRLLVSDEPFSLALPYSDRQEILVVPDEIVEGERQARRDLVAQDQNGDVDDLGKVVVPAVLAVAKPNILLPAATVELVVKGVMKLRERGLPIMMVARSEAESAGLRFSLGHPL